LRLAYEVNGGQPNRLVGNQTVTTGQAGLGHCFGVQLGGEKLPRAKVPIGAAIGLPGSLGTNQSVHAGVVLAYAAATVKINGISVGHAPRAQLLC
jgi:hypothetical protein